MPEKLEIDLFSRQQAWVAIKAQLFPFLRSALQGSGRWVLTVARRKWTRQELMAIRDEYRLKNKKLKKEGGA